MKKMMKTLALVATVAMGLTACQNDFEEQIEASNSVTIEFIADSAEGRTSVDTSGDKPQFSWCDSESFAVLEQTAALAKATEVTFAKDKEGLATITASFAPNADAAEYKYVAVHPEGGFVSAETLDAATLMLPAEQVAEKNSYDHNADLLVSKVVTTNTQQPAEAQLLQFTRLAAVAEMSFEGFVGSEEVVESVVFDVEGKTLAGKVTYDLTNPVEFTVAEGSSSVTVTADAASKIYFTLLPTTLEAGDTYSITVVTDSKIYMKSVSVPEGRSLEFAAGKVTRFGVNLATATVSDKWVLVKDASTLKEGDVVTFAAAKYNYVVGKQGGNYPIASQTEAVKIGNYLFHPIATATTTADNRIQHYTLSQRDNNRVAFDFYNGVDYDGDTSVGFLHATGSNNAPKLQAFCDVNTLFDVTISEGIATVKASDIEKTYKWLRYYNSTYASSRRFDMTTSEPTDNYQICVYRLAGAVGTIPTIAANVTVPTSDVVIAEEDTATPTAIEEVVFNYVGDWTINASAKVKDSEEAAEWLTLTYADGKLNYTAEANSGEVRYATVTITASLEGEEPLTWTFNVLQKGAPQEITIAEFITKEVNNNVEYKITGKLTSLASSYSSDSELTDANGNVAKFRHAKVGNDWLVGKDIVKVGDIVTIVAPVTYKGRGGSNSYPSTYKGHYRLSASVGVAADYTGGDVTISVAAEQNGSIVVPTDAVVGTMAECDYATLSYSGGDTATVSFPSENTTSEAREVEVTFTWGMASVTVAAQQGINPANKLGYELVTDASTLAVGDEVIIVAKNADKALACPTSTNATNFPAANIEKTGNVIYDAEKAGVQVFTLGNGVSDGTMSFDFTYKETGYRLYYSSGLKMRATSYTVNAATSWTIDINAEDGGDATITSTRLIKFNSATGAAFTAYDPSNANATKAENAVCIYKKQTSK